MKVIPPFSPEGRCAFRRIRGTLTSWMCSCGLRLGRLPCGTSELNYCPQCGHFVLLEFADGSRYLPDENLNRKVLRDEELLSENAPG